MDWKWGRTLAAGLLALALMALIAGCGGGGGLSASSSCKDFSAASPEDQLKAISSLSSEFDTPEYATPLGSPEVGYYCAGNPETTLEEFFKHGHEQEQGLNGAAQEIEGEGSSAESLSSQINGAAAVEQQLSGLTQEQLSLGDPNAPVELIEYCDLQSPICKSYSEEQLPKLMAGPISEGKAQLVFRNFNIIGSESKPAATAALAAGEQGKGWTFIELFYRNQGQEESGYVTDKFLTGVAEAAGVEDIPLWNEERESPTQSGQAQAQTESAEELHLTGTPSFAVFGPGNHYELESIGTPSTTAELEGDIEAAS